MSTPPAKPQIVSDWAPADQSANHLELALTDRMIKQQGSSNGQQQVIALRDTHDPGQVLYVTPGQIRSFSQSVTQRDTPAGRILAAATSST